MIYTEAKKKSEKAGSSTSSPSAPKKMKLAAMKQATMNDFQPLKVWGKYDPRAIKTNEKIINMIAIDNQPFSIVSDKGFIELLAHLEPRYLIPSRKYFNEVMLPRAYQNLTSDISKLLQKSSYFSFTTDIWTNSKTNISYLSLTAHWLNESFVYNHRVLHCREMEGRHTGLNISANIKDMLQNWGINLNQVHLIMQDNAYNMRLAMVLSNITSIP